MERLAVAALRSPINLTTHAIPQPEHMFFWPQKALNVQATHFTSLGIAEKLVALPLDAELSCGSAQGKTPSLVEQNAPVPRIGLLIVPELLDASNTLKTLDDSDAVFVSGTSALRSLFASRKSEIVGWVERFQSMEFVLKEEIPQPSTCSLGAVHNCLERFIGVRNRLTDLSVDFTSVRPFCIEFGMVKQVGGGRREGIINFRFCFHEFHMFSTTCTPPSSTSLTQSVWNWPQLSSVIPTTSNWIPREYWNGRWCEMPLIRIMWLWRGGGVKF